MYEVPYRLAYLQPWFNVHVTRHVMSLVNEAALRLRIRPFFYITSFSFPSFLSPDSSSPVIAP